MINITLDSGATVTILSLRSAKRLNVTIHKASQQAVQADGLSGLKVVGECHETFERDKVKFRFDALIVEGLSVEALGGMNFLYDNNIIPRVREGIIQVDKHMFPQTNVLATMKAMSVTT